MKQDNLEQVAARRAELRERLAELEHEQWISWTKHIAENTKVIDSPEGKFVFEAVVSRWKKNWKPYSELSEEVKDQDRIWADKVLALIP